MDETIVPSFGRYQIHRSNEFSTGASFLPLGLRLAPRDDESPT
jgi:hypothetical protein